jgi:NAD(P)-dependent dehydrogenase (short-subunit alcohol dehydrogenase family)
MCKVWLITGCSRGLGRELAQAVLVAGHRLVATARDLRDLDVLLPSDRLRIAPLDVTDPAAARAAVAVALSAFGRLDVLVNNAGHIAADSIGEGALNIQSRLMKNSTREVEQRQPLGEHVEWIGKKSTLLPSPEKCADNGSCAISSPTLLCCLSRNVTVPPPC